MKDNVIYEVVREFIDKDGNMDDFEVLSSGLNDYSKALDAANKAEVWKGNQISIWETDEKTLDLLNSWLISEFTE